MKNLLFSCALCVVACFSSAFSGNPHPADEKKATEQEKTTEKEKQMRLGNFSISLTVKDLEASREFYEKLGFKVFVGSPKMKMYILQNDASTIGLFHGEFEKNMLTYNPGWDRNCGTLPEFDDVRDIQSELIKRGLKPIVTTDEKGTGPGSIMLVDPDGNPILIDQHIPRPVAKE